jgi:hypothetical protein
MKIYSIINLIIFITYHEHQYFVIYIQSKLKIFDFSGNEIYMFFLDGVSTVLQQNSTVNNFWFSF